MHEYHITQSLLDQTLDQARQADAKEISLVHLRVGEISSFSEESIRFYWDQISAGTLAEGVELRFLTEEGKYYCRGCSTSFKSGEMQAACPYCGSTELEILAGSEVYLEALDIIPVEARSPV